MRSVFLFLLLGLVELPAQVYPGQYPGGYPPGGTPGNGPGIPIPRRGKRGSNDSQPLTQVAGKISKADDKHIVVDVPDGRVVQFLRTAKTRVYRNGQEVAATELKVGDQVRVEGTEDRDGILSAQTVRIDPSTPSDDAPPSEKQEPSSGTAKASPVPRDPDDPGPPELHRGVPAARPQTAENQESEPAPPVELSETTSDPVIEKARAAAAAFTQGLPDYVCTEFMTRYESSTKSVDWKPLDVVSTDIVYKGGKESYGNVQVNSKPAHKSIEEIGGSWSTGEFATTLIDLLSISTAAEFEYRRESQIAGATTRVYRFSVERGNSHWQILSPSQSMRPAYKGSIWIDPKSGRALRIEMQARALPEQFPLDTVESAVDYQQVRIGTSEYVLPVHADTLSCQRGSDFCVRNAIDFRNYHKFDAASSVSFDTSGK